MHFKKWLAALLVFALMLGAVPAFAAYDKPYYIDVDLTNQIVTVYNTSDGSIARQMLCSSGAPGHETIKGVFYLPAKDRDDERAEWYSFYTMGVYAKWATRIEGPYLFHAIPCYSKSLDDIVPRYLKQFGMPDSHGCVRLRVEDAYFIAKNCLRGTRVHIFESDELDEDLRQLLYISSYSEEDGMTYQEFLGISDDALGRGSSGSEVMDLQYRLSDLGYYEGEPTGAYDNQTIASVKRFQNDLGVADSGIATESLLEVIYSDEAPVADGQATLEEGKSGPAVKKLQLALKTLGVYNGEIDSVLDLEVTEAVKKFQSACNYPTDGVLTAELQQAIYYQEEKLKETFGDSIPAAELVAEEMWKGTLDAKANIIIRSQPDTKSENLGKIFIGDTMTVIKLEGDWAHIVYNGIRGYIYKKYLANPETEYSYNLLYTGADGKTYRIGHTIEEYLNGARSFASEFSDIYAGEKFKTNVEGDVPCVTVNTGSDDVKLNLRADANSEAEILGKVPNGTDLRVLSTEGEWTRVGYNDHIGYLMNQYLTFWEGTIEEAEENYVTLDTIDNVHEVLAGMTEKAMATVVAAEDEEGKTIKPRLYEEPNKKADKLATMAEGAEVEIAEFIAGDDGKENWVKVNYLGQTGYMLDMCLQFAFEGA